MHIELIGCTSAGKTTLANKIVVIGRQQGIDIILGDEFVLQKFHLNWVKSEFMRRRLLEICAGYICIKHWQKYRTFCRFVFGVSRKMPGSWFYQLNLVRIVLRKIGIHELIRRSSSENQIVLVDNEGIVQAAHNLFVHTGSSVNGNLSNFVQSAPLPDMIAYLKQPRAILLERTLRRGHPRIREVSQRNVQFFVEQAIETFEKLQTIPQIADKLFVIDGYNNSVIKPPSKNGHIMNQAYDLMKKSLMNNQAEDKPAKPGVPASPDLDLISDLAQQFRTNGIRYCHWKSNINIEESLKGKSDLDFFVSHESVSHSLHIQSQLGFKAAKIRYGPETPGVTHYYGLDISTGELIHVHLFTSIITGESFVKSHRFPFEEMLLENCESRGQLQVVSKEAELVLFVLRLFIKYGSLPDMLRLYGAAAELRNELSWLLDKDNIVKALALLNRFCPAVSETLFLNCVEAVNGNRSFMSRVLLARQIRRKLRSYSEYSFFRRITAYTGVLLAKVKCHLKGNTKNKRLASGGAVIAFVGADATGKSTLVAETERWLGKIFAVKKVHVGKPPASIWTFLFKMTLPLSRRFLPHLRRSRVQTRQSVKKSSQPDDRVPTSLLYAIRALILAWDRYKLLRQVARARAQGMLIICDRYPSEQTGAMDSPRLGEKLHKKGMKIALFNWLARKEGNLYEKMSPPDIAIKLKVSLETAKKRNTERIKEDKDTDEFIEARHRSAHEWHKSGTRACFEINTDQPMLATILNTKKVIWESL
jgi:thymidylate kinase